MGLLKLACLFLVTLALTSCHSAPVVSAEDAAIYEKLPAAVGVALVITKEWTVQCLLLCLGIFFLSRCYDCEEDSDE